MKGFFLVGRIVNALFARVVFCPPFPLPAEVVRRIICLNFLSSTFSTLERLLSFSSYAHIMTIRTNIMTSSTDKTEHSKNEFFFFHPLLFLSAYANPWFAVVDQLARIMHLCFCMLFSPLTLKRSTFHYYNKRIGPN